MPEQKFPNVAVQDYAASVLLEEFIPKHDADIQVIWSTTTLLTTGKLARLILCGDQGG